MPDERYGPWIIAEAPVSCNALVQVDGHQVQLTLRGVDEKEVLARMSAVLMLLNPGAPQLPPVQDATAPTEERAAAPQAPVAPPAWCHHHQALMRQGKFGWYHQVGEKYCNGHWCEEHQQQFRERNGEYGTFYSHRKDDGSYCREKPATTGVREKLRAIVYQLPNDLQQKCMKALGDANEAPGHLHKLLEEAQAWIEEQVEDVPL